MSARPRSLRCHARLGLLALCCALGQPAPAQMPPGNEPAAAPLQVINVLPRPRPQRAPLPDDMPAAERAKGFQPGPATEPAPAPTASASAGRGISDSPSPLVTLSADPLIALASEPSRLSSDNPNTFGTQELVFGLKINQTPIEAFVVAQAVDNKLFIPVGGLAQAIEFPITVEPAERRAAGWFVRETQTFKILDGTARVEGRSYDLKEGESVLFRNDDIYIAQPLAEKWFGMRFTADGREMILDISTQRPLPFEEKIIRARKLAMQGAQKPVEPRILQQIGLPYLARDVPYVDVTTLNTYDTRAERKFTSEYSLLSNGDFARHTTEAFLAGDFSKKTLSEARLKMERKDEGANLLGFMKASSYSFGDVNSAALAMVANSAQGRGVTLSNRSLYRAEQFDSTTLRGTASPGWDVELYRNDSLLSITTVGANSQYEFLNVPLFFGRNLFKIILYGPQGQIEEETREFYAGSTLLDPGVFNYNLSVSESDSSLFGLSDTPGPTSGLRAVGEVEYGVTKWLTLASGLGLLEQADGTHQYTTAGLRSSYWGTLASADVAYDATGGKMAGRLSAATSLLGVDVRAQQTFYNGMVSDENRTTADLLDTASELDLNTDLYLLSRTPLSVGLGVAHKTYVDGDESTLLRGRLSRNLFGFSASSTLEKGLGTTEYLKGTTSLRGSFWHVLMGARAEYDIEPEEELQRLTFSGQFRPFRNTTNRTELQIDAQREYEVRNTLAMDMKKYNLSLLTGGTSQGDYFIGMGLNFSFTQMPVSKRWHFQSQNMADTGGALLRAYLDTNSDFRREEGEDFLPDIRFRRDQSPINTREDETTTYITGLTPDRPARFVIDPDFSDPLRAPAIDGYEFIPRQGRTAILDFPVYESAQLDGTASRMAGGTRQPLPHIKIELTAEDGSTIQAVESEFDGYYLFENLRPGTYNVRIAGADSTVAMPGEQRTVKLEAGTFNTIDLVTEEPGPATGPHTGGFPAVTE